MDANVKYKTSDFYGACALRASGFRVFELIYRDGSSKATFVFDDPEQLADQLIHNYWDNKLSVDARTFVETINELKTRLHNQSYG